MCIQVYYTIGIIQEVVRARKMYFVVVSEQRPWGIGTGSRPIRGCLLLCPVLDSPSHLNGSSFPECGHSPAPSILKL